MKKAIWILWPSFIVAGVAEVLFFTLFDPVELHLVGRVFEVNRLAGYTIGFILFWLFAATSSAATLFFQKGSDEINR